MERLHILLCALPFVTTASAEEPQARPGVVRVDDNCFQGLFGNKVPCDERYKEGEKIAYWDNLFLGGLKDNPGPATRATWEAWRASAASGATTFEARWKAYIVEERKQIEQHTDVSKPFLGGVACQPNHEKEKNDRELLERN